MSGLQGGNGLLAGNARKGVQEFVEAVISLEVVDEIAKWDARPDEHGRPAEDPRIAVNSRRTCGHRELSG
jgi:hypothetical protein